MEGNRARNETTEVSNIVTESEKDINSTGTEKQNSRRQKTVPGVAWESPRKRGVGSVTHFPPTFI